MITAVTTTSSSGMMNLDRFLSVSGVGLIFLGNSRTQPADARTSSDTPRLGTDQGHPSRQISSLKTCMAAGSSKRAGPSRKDAQRAREPRRGGQAYLALVTQEPNPRVCLCVPCVPSRPKSVPSAPPFWAICAICGPFVLDVRADEVAGQRPRDHGLTVEFPSLRLARIARLRSARASTIRNFSATGFWASRRR